MGKVVPLSAISPFSLNLQIAYSVSIAVAFDLALVLSRVTVQKGREAMKAWIMKIDISYSPSSLLK